MKTLTKSLLLTAAIFGIAAPVAHADTTGVSLTQTIEAPISKLGFQNSSGQDLNDAHLDFPLRTARYQCQQNGKAPVATLGTTNQKLFASVPDRSAAGWDISIAPSNGTAAGWQASDGHIMRIDDSSNNGCGSGQPGDGSGGLLTVDTTEMTTADSCLWSCTDPIFLSQGPSNDFSQTSAVSLFSSASPHIGWEGTIGNINLRQTIPAGQNAGDYQLPLTVTLTEL